MNRSVFIDKISRQDYITLRMNDSNLFIVLHNYCCKYHNVTKVGVNKKFFVMLRIGAYLISRYP